MPRLVCRALAFSLGLAAICASGLAQEPSAMVKLHSWGRFEPGTWKMVRVVTETLNEQGQVISTNKADTKTTLVDIDKDGVTLKVEACMEVAGKRFRADPQTVKQGFHGEASEPNSKLGEPVEGELVIEDRKVPCTIQQLKIVGPSGKTVVTLYYSTTTPPCVLKRVCSTTAAESKNAAGETTTNTDVIAFDVPIWVQGEMHNGMHVKTVQKSAKATVTTLAVVLPDVPGGVVSHSSKEIDKNGRLVRRSTLELIDYSSDPDKDHSDMFGRKRSNRRSKQSSRYGQ